MFKKLNNTDTPDTVKPYTVFSMYFILVSVEVEPEPFLETLGVRQEHTLDYTPGHHVGTTHTLLHIGLPNLEYQHVLEGFRRPENLEETHWDSGRRCETPHRR